MIPAGWVVHQNRRFARGGEHTDMQTSSVSARLAAKQMTMACARSKMERNGSCRLFRSSDRGCLPPRSSCLTLEFVMKDIKDCCAPLVASGYGTVGMSTTMHVGFGNEPIHASSSPMRMA